MKVRQCNNGTQWVFKCPGCNETHLFDKGWSFNGDLDRPTISPSLLIRSGHFARHHKPGDSCWCTYNAEPHPRRHDPVP
jgi:hypothetical protein